MSVEWPEEKVDLNRAAELISAAWKPTSRSSASRFVKSRSFPHQMDGQRKLVDAKALCDAMRDDFSRATMAGETGLASAASPATPAPPQKSAPADDPRRDYHAMQAEKLRMEMAQAKRQLIPVEEAVAAVASSIGILRSALNEAVSAAAVEILRVLGAPAHREKAVVEVLKAMSFDAQAKFAAAFEPLAASMTPAGETPGDFLADLAAYALQLREGDVAEAGDAPAPAPEPIAAAG